MKTVNISKKQLVMMIRNGATYDSLRRKFEVNSNEELLRAISLISPDKASEYKKTLDKRQKESEKALAKKMAKMMQEEQNNEEEERYELEEYESEDCMSDEEPLVEETDSELISLDELYEQKEELSNQRVELEIRHKTKMEDRRSIESELVGEKKRLERLIEELSASKAIVLDLTQKYATLGIEMRTISEDIAVIQELQDEVEKQITSAEKFSICVYSDGSFDSDRELPDAEVSVEQELFTQLVSLEEAEELTIKAIKALVVMVRKVSKVKQTTDNIEVCYETESLQSFCEKVENLLETH